MTEGIAGYGETLSMNEMIGDAVADFKTLYGDAEVPFIHVSPHFLQSVYMDIRSAGQELPPLMAHGTIVDGVELFVDPTNYMNVIH